MRTVSERKVIPMTQEERRIYLIRTMQREMPEYAGYIIPDDVEGQKALLRGLFNIRMPYPATDEFLKVQDEYLRHRAEEKGITDCRELSPCRKDERICLWQGDITTLRVDAAVNAANSQMLGCWRPGHNCVDNNFHSFSGVQLRLECSRQMNELKEKCGEDYEQPTAVPMITPGYNLPAAHVIHVVGPIVTGPLNDRFRNQLSECYRASMELADRNECSSIAFCCISTGVFMFPQKDAAGIAVKTVREYLDQHRDGHITRVVFNVFLDSDLKIYDRILN